MILTNELQQVLHDVLKRRIGNGIQHKSAQRYACKFVRQLNKEEGKVEGKQHKTKTGIVKLTGRRHKRENKIYPMIDRFMLHHIYLVYHYISNIEEINADMILTSMSEHGQDKKLSKKLDDSRNNYQNNQPFLKKMNTPSELN